MKKVANIVLNDFLNDSRVMKTSKSLNFLGYDVTVVAMHNKNLPYIEKEKSYSVHRITLKTRQLPKIKFFQIIKYLEFLSKVIFYYRQYDIWHCNDISAYIIGVIAKLTKPKLKIIYDAHEYESEVHGLAPLMRRGIKLLEKITLPLATAVITVSNAIAEAYQKDYKIKKPHVILNCPNYTEQKPYNIFRAKFNIRQDQKIFLYQGGLSEGRGIKTIISAFESSPNDKNILVIMGNGTLKDYVVDKSQNSNNIFYHEAVSPHTLLNYTSSADYGISFIEDSCLNYRYCLPNKLFEYLMAGIPVLVSQLPEMEKIVNKYGVGIVAKHNDEKGLVDALNRSLNVNYQSLINNVLLTKKIYCWENQEKILKDIYVSIDNK